MLQYDQIRVEFKIHISTKLRHIDKCIVNFHLPSFIIRMQKKIINIAK